MYSYGLPLLFALFVWWLSTGLVLYAIGRPRSKHWQYMVVMTVLAGFALYALSVTCTDTSVSGAYCAFTSAIVVWAWHEMSFLTGIVTGPRVTQCPGRGRVVENMPAPFMPAVQSVIYHEFAIVATAAAIYAIAGSGENTTGLWTFVILWLMRLSAKLNVYLGVRNLTEEFLPDHLTYLTSYFCRRPMNGLFPVAVTLSTAVATLLIVQAYAAETPFDAASWTFLAMLMSLAVLEHWFLVIPLPAANLWSWGLKSRSRRPNSEGPGPSDHSGKLPSIAGVLAG